MAQVKPLTLKAAKAASKPKIVAQAPYVEVLVRIPFFSLEEVYTYCLPAGCEDVVIGDLVSLEFGNHITEGVVIGRMAESPKMGNLKPIRKRISKVPVFTAAQIDFAQLLAKEYVTSSWSFLDNFAPEFSAMGEKRFLQRGDGVTEVTQESKATRLPDPLIRRLSQDIHIRDLLVLPTLQPPQPILAEICRIRSQRGKIIVVLPDEKELSALSKELFKDHIAHTLLHSHLKKSERFYAYLQANTSSTGIFLTLRNGVFLDCTSADTIIVVNDVEEHHYQPAIPTWNTRNIALNRSDEISIIFLSHSPSVELVQETVKGRFTPYIFKQGSIKGLRFANPDGSEGNYRDLIRSSLKRGNVLISVGRAGYINSLSCRKCKNMAQCECGGRLYQPSSTSHPQCALCQKLYLTWCCPWCSSGDFNAASRGALRSAAEFAKAYPGYQVLYSSGDEQLRELDQSNVLVVATPGSEPIAEYSAIIILDAAHAYSHIDLRSQERVRSHWFSMLSKLSTDGVAYIGLPPHLEISQGLLRSDAFDLALRELHERVRVQLPPSLRLITVEGNHSDLSSLAALLSSKGLTSFPIEGKNVERSKLLIKVPLQDVANFTQLLHSIMRIRTLKREGVLAIAFDPYSP